MSKHTPGPWETYVNANNDVTIRKMFPDGTECCQIARCKSSFANARLIAAAPELLEALKAGPSAEHPPVDGEICLCWQCEFVRLRRAAIAKAEGKQ